MSIIVVLVLFVTNVGRLGHRNGTLAILALLGLGVAYLAVWPLVRVLAARPRPRPALALAAANCGAFAYVLASGLFRLPGFGYALVLAILCLWTLIVAYRRIVLPSLFARSGGFGERLRVIREARRASRAEIDALLPPE
jgi:drug/metabolite transporter (DMT)-like permease